MPGRLTPPQVQQGQFHDPYDYARSPVEQGINTLFDTAQQMYRQKAEYNWQLQQMKQQEAIKQAQMTQAQDKIDLTGQLLEERTRHQKETEATAKANQESQAGYRKESLAARPTQANRVEIANINAQAGTNRAIISAGPSYARLKQQRAGMIEGTDESGQIYLYTPTTDSEKEWVTTDDGATVEVTRKVKRSKLKRGVNTPRVTPRVADRIKGL
jgi:hypothetical protein